MPIDPKNHPEFPSHPTTLSCTLLALVVMSTAGFIPALWSYYHTAMWQLNPLGSASPPSSTSSTTPVTSSSSTNIIDEPHAATTALNLHSLVAFGILLLFLFQSLTTGPRILQWYTSTLQSSKLEKERKRDRSISAFSMYDNDIDEDDNSLNSSGNSNPQQQQQKRLLQEDAKRRRANVLANVMSFPTVIYNLHKLIGYVLFLPVLAFLLHSIWLVFAGHTSKHLRHQFVKESEDFLSFVVLMFSQPQIFVKILQEETRLWHFWWGVGSVMVATSALQSFLSGVSFVTSSNSIMAHFFNVFQNIFSRSQQVGGMRRLDRRLHAERMCLALVSLCCPGLLRTAGFLSQSLIYFIEQQQNNKNSYFFSFLNSFDSSHHGSNNRNLSHNRGDDTYGCDFLLTSGYVTVMIALCIVIETTVEYSLYGSSNKSAGVVRGWLQSVRRAPGFFRNVLIILLDVALGVWTGTLFRCPAAAAL